MSNFISLVRLFQLCITVYRRSSTRYSFRTIVRLGGESRRGEHCAPVEESSTSFRRIVLVRSIVPQPTQHARYLG